MSFFLFPDLLLSPKDARQRTYPVFDLCLEVQQGVEVEVTYTVQGCTGAQTALDVAQADIELVVVKGVILLLKC